MDCPQCNALAGRRNRLWREYSEAATILNASYASPDAEHYMRLRALADVSLIEFQLAEAEFRQHQDRHAVPN
jgi:hypothetical protein